MQRLKILIAIIIGVTIPVIFYFTYMAIMFTVKNTPIDSWISVAVIIMISCSILYVPIGAIGFAYNNLK